MSGRVQTTELRPFGHGNIDHENKNSNGDSYGSHSIARTCQGWPLMIPQS